MRTSVVLCVLAAFLGLAFSAPVNPAAPTCCFKHGVGPKTSANCSMDLTPQMEQSAKAWPLHGTQADNWIGWDCSQGYFVCCLVAHTDDTWLVRSAAECDTKQNPEVTGTCQGRRFMRG
jgi:hypothetical protein